MGERRHSAANLDMEVSCRLHASARQKYITVGILTPAFQHLARRYTECPLTAAIRTMELYVRLCHHELNHTIHLYSVFKI
jgi:hypothetical protein